MAKKPTTTKTAEKATVAPAQPWAKPGDQAAPASTIDPGSETSADAKPEGEVTSEQKDQVTPSGANPSEQVSELLGSGAEGNGGGADTDDTDDEPEQLDGPDENAPEGEVTSIEKDQVTPTGKSPEQIAEEAARVSASLHDAAGNRLQGVPPREEVISEAKDQVTPHGTDIALGLDKQKKVPLARSAVPTANDTLGARLAALSPEDQAEFQAEIEALAEKILDRMERGHEAKAMAANMVRGQDVYGNRARRANHDDTLGGLSNGNVQLNRRARRQAERVMREEQSRKTQK